MGVVRLRALTVSALAIGVAGCHREEPRRPPPPVPVTVARAVTASVPVELHAVGTVTPVDAVAVSSRVDGRLEEVRFREGDYVQQGALLFVIDPRPFQAALRQAQAAVRRDRAQAVYDARDAQRYAVLLRRQLVAAEDYEQRAAAAHAAAATVAADEAAVRTAQLDLGYTHIRAPIAGVTGNLQITLGNQIRANDTTPMVVLRRISPIYVSFAVPGDELPAIRDALAHGRPTVLATPRGARAAATGALSFVDSTIDPATGTLLLKATFANAARTLWPGEFVDADLRLGTEAGVVVIPERAVQIGQQGDYVFVVRGDGTAEQRPVVLGTAYREWVVVRRGVSAGERVVTDGQLGLVTGTRVAVKSAP